jgi:hypothetical protein
MLLTDTSVRKPVHQFPQAASLNDLQTDLLMNFLVINLNGNIIFMRQQSKFERL